VHQRGRLAVSFITLKHAMADRTIEKLVDFVESNTDAKLVGWTTEKLEFDEDASLS